MCNQIVSSGPNGSRAAEILSPQVLKLMDRSTQLYIGVGTIVRDREVYLDSVRNLCDTRSPERLSVLVAPLLIIGLLAEKIPSPA